MAEMMQPTQVEAHINRLRAVRSGLEKYIEVDGRAAEGVNIIDVAINCLSQAPYAPPEPDEVTDQEPDEATNERGPASSGPGA